MAEDQPPSLARSSMLDLPDTALLTVLRMRCLAADCGNRSLFSAARACSALHQLSAAALTSISATVNQQQLDSLQLYLSRHSRHVKRLMLHGGAGARTLLNELPACLQLNSLSVTGFWLQLLPGGGRSGVLPLGTPLKQLEMCDCDAFDRPPDAALAQALSQLPQLEHIKYSSTQIAFPGHVLSDLQQLTSLDVVYSRGDVLEFVHLAPGLRDLKAHFQRSNRATTSKLSALQHLTSLQLEPASAVDVEFSPAALANMTHLQRLRIEGASLAGGPAGVAALLSELQQMTQLTHLALQRCWDLWVAPDVPYDPSGLPAAAYAALTASSTLQHLDVSNNTMPQGVWQHVLPADRQLPQLRALNASQCGTLGCWTHADTARLASCCPNLQELYTRTREPMAADALHPLRSLTALTALEAGDLDDAGFAAAAELTQLRQLRVWRRESATDAGLLQLTQLRLLSSLDNWHHSMDVDMFEGQEPEGQPVWRQVLQHCLKSMQPDMAELAQHAAASLEQLVL